MLTTIFSTLIAFFKLIYPFRNELFDFAKKIYLYNANKDEFNRIMKFNKNQIRELKGKKVKLWSKSSGQTTVKLIKSLYMLESKKDFTIIFNNKTLQDGKNKLKTLESIINATPNINSDNFSFKNNEISNKINNSKIIITSIRSKKPNYNINTTYIDDSTSS